MADEEKYGKVLEALFIAEDSYRPIRISLVEQKGVTWLDIRSMYRTHGKDTLRFGKGVRIEMDEGTAEEVILAAGAMLSKHLSADVEE